MTHAATNLKPIATRVLLLTGLWITIAGTATSAWLVGVPAIVAATWTSVSLTTSESWGFSAKGALRFVGFFLLESLRGGFDVARRILGTRLRILPGFIIYRCRLPADLPRVLFTNCVSLLPGTLAADLRDDALEIHVLDTQLDVNEELAHLEQAVADLFAIALPAQPVSGVRK